MLAPKRPMRRDGGAWYKRLGVRGTRGPATGAIALIAIGAAGCGGTRQDASEPSRVFPMRVTTASFPALQHISHEARMRITVQNVSRKTVPNVAVTIITAGNGTRAAAFSDTSAQPGLASTSRPTWIVDKGPTGGDTAYTNTWALGELAPLRSRTFTWNVSPIRAGRYALIYTVSAGLNGKALAIGPGGRRPRGAFRVFVSGRPAQARVTGAGKVVTGGG
jgi:hypothetical protein